MINSVQVWKNMEMVFMPNKHACLKRVKGLVTKIIADIIISEDNAIRLPNIDAFSAQLHCYMSQHAGTTFFSFWYPETSIKLALYISCWTIIFQQKLQTVELHEVIKIKFTIRSRFFKNKYLVCYI